MDVNHGLIVKTIEEEMNNNFKSPLENQLAKKRFIVNASVISNFLGAINPYKKDNVH
jgi:selenocysteine lyase/cysteine desulfurase